MKESHSPVEANLPAQNLDALRQVNLRLCYGYHGSQGLVDFDGQRVSATLGSVRDSDYTNIATKVGKLSPDNGDIVVVEYDDCVLPDTPTVLPDEWLKLLCPGDNINGELTLSLTRLLRPPWEELSVLGQMPENEKWMTGKPHISKSTPHSDFHIVSLFA